MVMLEPRRSDGSTPGVGCMEDILQFALKPKPANSTTARWSF